MKKNPSEKKPSEIPISDLFGWIFFVYRKYRTAFFVVFIIFIINLMVVTGFHFIFWLVVVHVLCSTFVAIPFEYYTNLIEYLCVCVCAVHLNHRIKAK